MATPAKQSLEPSAMGDGNEDRPSTVQVVNLVAACFKNFFGQLCSQDVTSVVAKQAIAARLPDPRAELPALSRPTRAALKSASKAANPAATGARKGRGSSLYTLFVARMMHHMRANNIDTSANQQTRMSSTAAAWSKMSKEQKDMFNTAYQPFLDDLKKRNAEADETLKRNPEVLLHEMEEYERKNMPANAFSKLAGDLLEPAGTPKAPPQPANGVPALNLPTANPEPAAPEAKTTEAKQNGESDQQQEKKKKKKKKKRKSGEDREGTAPVDAAEALRRKEKKRKSEDGKQEAEASKKEKKKKSKKN